jgi:hypothetical protein
MVVLDRVMLPRHMRVFFVSPLPIYENQSLADCYACDNRSALKRIATAGFHLSVEQVF